MGTLSFDKTGLPLLAQIAHHYVPAEVWDFLEPYWVSVALGFLAFISSRGAHLVGKRRQASRTARIIGR